VSCPRVLVALDHPVTVESPCWTIFQQTLSPLLHLSCAWVEPWVASIPLSTHRRILCSLSCKPVLATWYGPSPFVGDGHPSWPLDVTENSGIFKVVHYRNFVAVSSSNPYALCAGENTVLPISRMEWTQPTQIFMMVQSLDASVSILMSVRLVTKSVTVAEACVLCICMTELNSSGWNSFLTSCPFLPY
jgi:hypothetical protein